MKRVSFILTLLLLCTFVSYGPAGEVRKWTAGSHSVEGEFVELLENGSIVRIRKTDGKFTRVPLAKLSEEDQEYVKEEAENPFEDETEGTTLPASSRKAGERMVLKADGIEYAFRWCPSGEFIMGSPEDEKEREDDEIQHRVKLTKGFWMLETEVTQAMWESVMDENPSEFKGGQNPVEQVSWDDCQEFCEKLSQKLGQQVQLPTEAQWEYACRAGTTTPFSFGNTLNGDEANCDGNYPYGTSAKGTYLEKTSVAGSYSPNAWGLYDMHGNVYEWCSDYYDENYYAKSSISDPENTTASSNRVFRGGCWEGVADRCRSALRRYDSSDFRRHYLGLRPVLVPGQE